MGRRPRSPTTKRPDPPPRRPTARRPKALAVAQVAPSVDPIWEPFIALAREAPFVAFIKDPEGHYVYANPYLLATVEQMGPDWQGKTDADIWPPEVAASVRANDEAALQEGALRLFTQGMPLGGEAHSLLVMKFPIRAEDGRVYLCGLGVDQTAQLRMVNERDRLAAAVEQSSESVMIAGIDGRITYVNPAFERITGYAREEVLGKNPRILNSGVQPSSFYKAMWAALSIGLPWVADFVNRRKDGSLFTEEAVISTIRNEAGAPTGYVAVKRDVTQERTLERRSGRAARERALIGETLRSLRAGNTPEESAQAISRQVLSLSGIVSAQVFIFELDGRAVPLGFAVSGQPDPPLKPLPFQRSRHLRERAAQGPWIEAWVPRRWHPYNTVLSGLGDHLVAYAPMRFDRKLIGLLVIDASESVSEASLSESLPALVEFADLAGALVGRDIGERIEGGKARDRILDILATQAFGTVFQPIVQVDGGAVVGYEALTRFDDGVSPYDRFGQAKAVGLGPDLELATLQASLVAAKGLARSAWLSLNASPELILARQPLGKLLRSARRRVVLEVTEHAEILNYEAFRAAVADLGPKVELAVDDAGAGFASLRHILELRPAYVKLDRWLIASVESDEARQAMIVGLQHFARVTGCLLIAEGVETPDELAVLRTMEISLAQGYLLGRPTGSGSA